jgi:uncharacterized protein YecE (DUF72 family)
VRLLAGTSGYAFKEWKGVFYPPDVSDDAWLGYYAGKFPTVEINNTFYRLPKQPVLEQWADQVPASFTFAIKASMRITHHARLKPACATALDFLLQNTAILGERCGPILFQLPPQFEADADRLAGFFKLLSRKRRYSFEFRHPSWYQPRILRMLADENISLCLSDHHDAPAPWKRTADFVYVRGHGPSGRYHGHYTNPTLAQWARRIKSWKRQGCDVYVYFDNDQKSAAPADAQALKQLL